jgi:hypothetical protein
MYDLHYNPKIIKYGVPLIQSPQFIHVHIRYCSDSFLTSAISLMIFIHYLFEQCQKQVAGGKGDSN